MLHAKGDIAKIDKNSLNYHREKGYIVKAFDVMERRGFDVMCRNPDDGIHLVVVAYSGTGPRLGEFKAEVRWIDSNGVDRPISPEISSGIVDGIIYEQELRGRLLPVNGRTFFVGLKGRPRVNMGIQDKVICSWAFTFAKFAGRRLHAAMANISKANTPDEAAEIAKLMEKVDSFSEIMNEQGEKKHLEIIDTNRRRIDAIKAELTAMEENHSSTVERYLASRQALSDMGIPYDETIAVIERPA